MRLPFLTLVAAAALAASTAHGAERLAPRVAAPSRAATFRDSLGDGWYLRGASDVAATRGAVAGQPPGSVFGALGLSNSGFARRDLPVRVSGDISP